MPSSSIDVRALASAMEVRVKSDDISWRTAAGQIGVSPSQLTRLRNGQRPDLEAFASITRWLRHPADEFIVDPNVDDSMRPTEPPLESSIYALLRAQPDLDDADRAFLQDILVAGLRRVQQQRDQAEH